MLLLLLGLLLLLLLGDEGWRGRGRGNDNRVVLEFGVELKDLITGERWCGDKTMGLQVCLDAGDVVDA